ncbi:prephenate dehydrogenase/arogenate dehydrogenase family protein [Natronosalvus vescus]|uniref:prephenate dehydrogenase/arogenate dehydrogenase family protein n=1 Tax=Natronosalvus vescus TaxID=2953881 RepID=UPI00209079DC|nr:prephenate dehydrogenase/arogenate dehydrogenase family protein [Natronosalvus vescus]
MDVLIVGAGAMGVWVGSTLVDADGVEAAITFVDVDPETAERAAATVGGTIGDPDGEEGYDAVCIAVPMRHAADAIERYAPRAERALIDVTGVMETPLEAMAEHAPERERLSLHPLFAPERAPGSIATVQARGGPVTNQILSALEAAGNRLVETTAEEHDRAMESVQASAHAAILSFALAARPAPDGFETPIYEELRRLTTFVTNGTPRVYADIQTTFDGADAVAEAARAIADAADEDGETTFESLFEEAARTWSGAPDQDARTPEATTDEPGGDRQ